MPIWCPNCDAMLPEGQEECPRCGEPLTRSGKGGDAADERKAIFWLSAYTIGIVLIPIIAGVVIGLICILLFVAGQR
jgi:uncharacterized membrane protein YvbJ